MGFGRKMLYAFYLVLLARQYGSLFGQSLVEAGFFCHILTRLVRTAAVVLISDKTRLFRRCQTGAALRPWCQSSIVVGIAVCAASP